MVGPVSSPVDQDSIAVPPAPRAAPLPTDPAAIAAINAVLFPARALPPADLDVCLILGSRNCGYRVDAAVAHHAGRPQRYIVSGGGRMPDGRTEAAFMAARLHERGVPAGQILREDSSRYTAENLRCVRPLLATLGGHRSGLRILLVTAGFHLCRTLALAEEALATLPGLQLFPLAAYGPHTRPDNWHTHAVGRQAIAGELAKLRPMGLLPEPLAALGA